MANLPRYAIIENASTFHVTWQCHNKDWLLKDDWAKKIYYDLLLKYKKTYQVLIYSYCFMSNHPHLTGFCFDKNLFSDFFRTVNSCFAKAINRELKRRGQVVMDRFKSPRIESDNDLLKVMTYIDLNPKRAKMVKHPKYNSCSSFAHYAYGKKDELIDEAPSYTQLGKTPDERQRVYLKLVDEIIKNDWEKREPYSSVNFIGNPDWVIKKSKALHKECEKKRKKWLTRRKLLFNPHLSP